jgi:hypothetical protein
MIWIILRYNFAFDKIYIKKRYLFLFFLFFISKILNVIFVIEADKIIILKQIIILIGSIASLSVLLSIYDINEIIESFYKFFVFLSISAIASFFLCFFKLQDYFSFDFYEYKCILLTNIVSFGFVTAYFKGVFPIIRQGSLFWEPGIFQFFLNFFIVYALFYRKIKTPWYQLFILIIGVILTQSGMGYPILFIVLSIYIFKIILTNKKYKQYFYNIFAISISIFVLLYFKNIFKYATDKISLASASFGARYMHILFALECFNKNVFAGIGIGNRNIEPLVNMPLWVNPRLYEYDYTNISNSYFSILAHQGIIGVIIYFIIFIILFRNAIKHKKVFFLIPLMLTLFTEPLINSYVLIFTFFIISEFKNNNNR